jgi:tRNA G18 (ribose-2'-O)-methylase SpoU
MFHVRSIESLDLPELAPYRTMRGHPGHHREGIFVAEGDKVVRRLLESPLGVVSLLITENWLEPLSSLLLRRTEEIPVYVAPRIEMERIVGFPFYQGSLAVGRTPLPESLDSILGRSARPFLLMAVDGMSNAENMGILIRNCAAFGVQALIAGETCAAPYLRRSVRNSMGAIFKLPIVQATNLVTILELLRERGLLCIAAHPHSQQLSLPNCDLSRDCCIVLGSEGYGLSPETLKSCDELVAIPMANDVDSLNVGNAGAVFLYEANRQRRKMLGR